MSIINIPPDYFTNPPHGVVHGPPPDIDYTQYCGVNCDFCLGPRTTRDCVECSRYGCASYECFKKCCDIVVPVFGVGGFYACKECKELMKGCKGCMKNAGEACSAECIKFKKEMTSVIERRRLQQEREAQARDFPPMAANSMSHPPGVTRPQSAQYEELELGGKNSKSRGLRRRKSKSKSRGLRRRKSKSKSRGLRRRKTMTSRG